MKQLAHASFLLAAAFSWLSCSAAFVLPSTVGLTFLRKASVPQRRSVCISMTSERSDGRNQDAEIMGNVLATRKEFFQRTLLTLGTAALTSFAPKEAEALCGSKPSSWEFWIPWDETGVKTTSGAEGAAGSGERTIFYRVVGDKSREKEKLKGKEIRRKPIIVVADKFKDHNYLTIMEAVVTSDRRVVLYDAMGEGESEVLPAALRSKLSESEEAALAFSVKELSDLVVGLKKDLGVSTFHLYGDSYGAKVVSAFAAANPSSVSSLVLARPPKELSSPQGLKVLYTTDPSGLCTPDSAPMEREAYVKTVNEFADEVDGSSSL